MSKRIQVFMNGDTSKSCSVVVHEHRTLKDILSDCKDQFSIDRHRKCKLYDSTGCDLSDDDLDYLNPDEPLFLSRGENFSKQSSIAIYREIRKLGQGGFGSVWLYQNKISKEMVAIKFVELRSLGSPEEINRVYSEINVLRSLKHPHIVQLIDAFLLNRQVCFVMEYCAGGELSQYLNERNALPEEEVYNIAQQMTDAIRFCHASNVVHRDLKLENIMFSSQNRTNIKIVDFGIAGMLANGGERSDAGSLHYIAPEVISGNDNRANPALDIWSMGCILYNLLTNKIPFYGNTDKEIAKSILEGRYPPLGPSVRPPWQVLVKGMLRIHPRKRWDLLRVSEHLRKHSRNPEAPLTEESEEEKEERKAPAKKKLKNPITPRQRTNRVHGRGK